MFKSGPNYTKLKTNMRLIINRLKLLEKKKTEMALKSRKEIADYISAGKEDRARIRVEHIIREDYLVEAMELLEMYCDLLLARFGLIQTQKELDPGLEESIATIIWATPRLQADVQELRSVTDEFTKKYGPEFSQECRGNKRSNVSEKVIHKLSVQAPPKALVEHYMVEIAKTYNVPFEPEPSATFDNELSANMNLLTDFDADTKNQGWGGPNGGIGAPQPHSYPPPSVSVPHLTYTPASANVPSLSTDMPHGGYNPYPQIPPGYNTEAHSAPPGPQVNQLYGPPKPARRTGPSNPAVPSSKGVDVFPELPTVPSNTLPDLGNSVGGSDDVNFDDLNRRFEELKKKK
uniref:IST1 homolog n=1 Tax=Arion vulgaris TaxID=1028688 RepID=A0A0B6ZH11_9EUPU